MKVFVFGTRGIPGILGGVETHCEMIYPAILSKSIFTQITVICRRRYVRENQIPYYKGVKIKSIYAPKSKTFEAIVHSFLAALYTIRKRPDIVHIHAVGPNLMTPVLRLFGLKVIMTHHGPDYEREKWKKIEKIILKVGEFSGVRFSNKVIVISNQIAENVYNIYKRNDCVIIPNGVGVPVRSPSLSFLSQYNLKKGKYFLAVGRFVPEKGFDYLIRAYKKSGLSNHFKLVIAGDSDHITPYSASLKELANRENVILTGFIKGDNLAQIYSNAALFIIPSFYEGLPIALLEAMNYDLDILASDIVANKQMNLPGACYFKTGNEDDLSRQIANKIFSASGKPNYDMTPFNWEKIALETLHTYQSLSLKSIIRKSISDIETEILINEPELENISE